MAKRTNGNTKMMALRVSPELWAALERMAERNRTTVSEIARQGLWHMTLRDALTPCPDDRAA